MTRTRLFSLSRSLLIVTIASLVIFGSLVIINFKNPLYFVDSNSMAPALRYGDLVFVYKIPFEELKIEDIIVFHKTYDVLDFLFIHRIIEIRDMGGETVVKTKGDNNVSSFEGIDYPITEEDYRGKMIFSLPGAGSVLKILDPPVNYVIILICGGLFLFKLYPQIVQLKR